MSTPEKGPPQPSALDALRERSESIIAHIDRRPREGSSASVHDEWSMSLNLDLVRMYNLIDLLLPEDHVKRSDSDRRT